MPATAKTAARCGARLAPAMTSQLRALTLLAVPLATLIALGGSSGSFRRTNRRRTRRSYSDLSRRSFLALRWSLRVSATILAGPAALDGAHVPDHRRGRRAALRCGKSSLGLSLAAAALFSQSRRACSQSLIERSRAALRQHLAFAPAASFAATRSASSSALITGICIGWFPPARYWGMPLLESRRADSGHRLDSAGDGLSPIRDVLRGRAGRARRLVPGHDADHLRHCQHARLVPRCRAHARRGAGAISSSASPFRPRCRTFSSACSWASARPSSR